MKGTISLLEVATLTAPKNNDRKQVLLLCLLVKGKVLCVTKINLPYILQVPG